MILTTYSFKSYVLKTTLMPLCIVHFQNTEGANISAQRKLQTPTSQCSMCRVSQSTLHFLFLLLCTTPYCFIQDLWCMEACPLSAPVSAVGLVTPLHVHLHRSWGGRGGLSGVGGQDHTAFLYFKEVSCLPLSLLIFPD